MRGDTNTGHLCVMFSPKGFHHRSFPPPFILIGALDREILLIKENLDRYGKLHSPNGVHLIQFSLIL